MCISIYAKRICGTWMLVHQSDNPAYKMVVFEIGWRGRLIPQWSQDCLEACCVWSVSGHFNISPRPWIGPHVALPIIGGQLSSILLPPSAGLPHHVAPVCHFVLSTILWPPTSLCFYFAFFISQHISFKLKQKWCWRQSMTNLHKFNVLGPKRAFWNCFDWELSSHCQPSQPSLF